MASIRYALGLGLVAMAALNLGCESERRGLLQLAKHSGKVRVHAKAEGGDAQITSARVRVTGVQARNVAGEFFAFQLAAPQDLELVALSATVMAPMLGAAQLPDGLYDHFRVITESSGMVTFTDNSTQVLDFPSGSTSGVKVFLGEPLEVKNGLISKIEVTFDLSRSFTITGAGFTSFMPVVRVGVTTYGDPNPEDDSETNPPDDDVIVVSPPTDDGSIDYPPADGVGTGS